MNVEFRLTIPRVDSPDRKSVIVKAASIGGTSGALRGPPGAQGRPPER